MPPNVVHRRSSVASTTRCYAQTRSSMPERGSGTYWLAPIVADAEAGFGGPLNAFELMKAMIEAGAAGVHFEDQLAVGEEVRSSGRQGARPDAASSSRTLAAARLAADVCDVPTILVARTDALSATLLTSDVDEARPPSSARASGRRRASSGSAPGSSRRSPGRSPTRPTRT